MSVSEPSLSAAIDSEALMANNNTAVCHKSLIETARLAFQIINSMRSEQQLEEIDANIQEIFLQSVETSCTQLSKLAWTSFIKVPKTMFTTTSLKRHVSLSYVAASIINDHNLYRLIQMMVVAFENIAFDEALYLIILHLFDKSYENFKATVSKKKISKNSFEELKSDIKKAVDSDLL